MTGEQSPQGLFVVIEGIDGAGKSSTITCLASSLRRLGHRVITTKEPTDGPYGRRIRSLYKGTHRDHVNALTEAKLFVEDRRQDVDETILPALADGCIVLGDRYFYSNIAYQGVRGVPEATIREMNREFPVPDLVFLIDIEPHIGISRIVDGRKEQVNSFEGLDQLVQVRYLFLALTDKNIIRIDGDRPQADICEIILDRILGHNLKEVAPFTDAPGNKSE